MPPYVVAGFPKVCGELSAIGSLAFGCADATVGKFNGARLRQLLEGRHMCTVNTYRECEPTYDETTSWGTRWTTYACLKVSYMLLYVAMCIIRVRLQ